MKKLTLLILIALLTSCSWEPEEKLKDTSEILEKTITQESTNTSTWIQNTDNEEDYEKYYEIKENEIFYKWFSLSWADVNTFEILWKIYSKDKNKVYYKSSEIEWADAGTFQVFIKGWYYAKDKNYVYYDNKKIVEADLETFEACWFSNFYWKDKNHFYYDWKVIDWVDLNTFEYIEQDYAKDKNNIYFRKKKLESADLETFIVFWELWAKDKKNIYNFDNKIKKPWDMDLKSLEYVSDEFLKDKNNVFYWNRRNFELIKWVDSETFELLWYDYSRDKNNVYFRDRKLELVDPKTVKYLSGSLIKDKNSVYFYSLGWKWGLNIVSWINDIDSFEYLGEGYAKDKDFVYIKNDDNMKKIENCDVKTFEMLEFFNWKLDDFTPSLYWKDKKEAYYNWKVINEADIETFDLVDWWFWDYAKDVNNIYFYWKKFQNADPETFEVISSWQQQDKDFVYLKNEFDDIITIADRKTFEKLEYPYARDKNNCYNIDSSKIVDMKECDDVR